MLPLALRKALFFLFLGIFLVSAPLVVLYTAGYRINRTNNTVFQTGTLSLASTPRGASLSLEREPLPGTTPTILQRLSPGERTVTLQKKGYHVWERSVLVQSGSTSYVTAPLFLDESPMLLAQGSADWEHAQTARAPQPIELPKDILLTSTTTGVELSRASLGSTTLLALLPADTYMPLAFGDEDLFLKNSRGEILALSLTRAQATIPVGRDVIAFAWDNNERRLAWSDGLEIHLFSAATHSQELITRQSDVIQSLAFAHDGESLVVASSKGITGIDLLSYVDGRLQTTLATFAEPVTVWFSEEGNSAYIATESSLSSLALTR